MIPELKTGQLLELKPNAIITYAKFIINSSLLPIWEVGYSNLTDSDKYYDLIPKQRFSLDKEMRSETNLSFFLELEKSKVKEFFELYV